MARHCERIWGVPQKDLDIEVDIQGDNGVWFELKGISKRNSFHGGLDLVLENGRFDTRLLHMRFHKGSLEISFTDISSNVTAGDDTCPICLDTTKDETKIRRTTCCRRVFHSNCADAAWMHQETCPICRGTETDFAVPIALNDPGVSESIQETVSHNRDFIAEEEKFWGKQDVANCRF
jgi:hypothetical protein